QSLFTYIGNVPRNFLRSKLGVARANLELVDVNGSVNIFLHHLFGNHDGIFEVVSVPRHERDEYIASSRKLAMTGVWAVGGHVAALHVLTFAHNRLLVHACAGV